MSNGGMNKFIKIVAVLLLLPLSVVIPTLSLESYYTLPTSAQTTTDASLEERKEAYKAKLKEELSSAVQQRIKLRCLAVQTNIKALNVRVETVQTKRGAAYEKILTKLEDLTVKLDAKAYDTTSLKENISTLSAKVDAYKAAMDDYSQAVEDLTVIDCAQDPTSFKAALEEARTQHEALVGSVRDIREFVLNTIKPQLQVIRADFVKAKEAETTTTTETTETNTAEETQ